MPPSMRIVQAIARVASIAALASGSVLGGPIQRTPQPLGALGFEKNVGQEPPGIEFVLRGGDRTVYLTRYGVLSFGPRCDQQASMIRMEFEDANPAVRIQAVERRQARVNVLRGNDPKRWHRDVPLFQRVWYRGIYEGIDVAFIIRDGELAYDFYFMPGAAPDRVTMGFEFDGSLSIDEQGGLRLITDTGEVHHQCPRGFQTGLNRRPISTRFALVEDSSEKVTLDVGPYDASRPLLVDPTLTYASYFGGSGDEYPTGVALARNGIIVSGTTWSANLPTANPYQGTIGGQEDGFVAKFDRSGSILEYATYLGGTDSDRVTAVAVDEMGRAHVTGHTLSSDFPVVSPIQAVHAGFYDAFVSILSPDGSTLEFSTFLGGTNADQATAITLGPNGHVYTTGSTSSVDFPLVNPYQGSMTLGGEPCFVARMDPMAGALVYSTYLGYGTDHSWCRDVALDPSLRIHVAGTTTGGIPQVNPIQPGFGGGHDVFLTVFAASGATLDFSSYLGGSELDSAGSMLIGPNRTVFVAGRTWSDDFPTVNAPQSANAGFWDGFLTEVDTTSPSLLWSTYLGGWFDEDCCGLALAPGGRLIAVGSTSSSDFPTVDPVQPGLSGIYDAFVSSYNPPRTSLDFSTFLGGSASDLAMGLLLERSGSIFLCGYTDSTDFPVTNPFQSANAGGDDLWFARLCILWLHPALLPDAQVGIPYSEAIVATGGTAPYSMSLASGSLPPGLQLTSTGALSGVPTTAGSYPFRIEAIDATGCASSHEFVIDVSTTGCSITITPATLPPARVATPYQAALSATGGTAPYTFSLAMGSLPPGIILSPTGVLAGTAGAFGVFSFVIQALDSAGCAGVASYDLPVLDVESYLTGTGIGPTNPSRIRVFSRTGGPTTVDFRPYAASWGANVAPGRISSVAQSWILSGPGAGRQLGPHVRAFDRTGTPWASVNFFAYATLSFGVHPSASSIDTDPWQELLTGVGPGSQFGPHVRGWNVDGVATTAITDVSFFAYPTPRFGVEVGGADLDSDDFAEIITGQGPGPGLSPRVRAFDYDGTSIRAVAGVDFAAYGGFYGVNVEGGDVDADGFDEIITARGPGPTNDAHLDGFNYDASSVAVIPGFSIRPFTTYYGARAGTSDLTADGRADLAAGAGPDPGADSTVLSFSYDAGSLTPIPGSGFRPFPGSYGVNASGGALGY